MKIPDADEDGGSLVSLAEILGGAEALLAPRDGVVTLHVHHPCGRISGARDLADAWTCSKLERSYDVLVTTTSEPSPRVPVSKGQGFLMTADVAALNEAALPPDVLDCTRHGLFRVLGGLDGWVLSYRNAAASPEPVRADRSAQVARSMAASSRSRQDSVPGVRPSRRSMIMTGRHHRRLPRTAKPSREAVTLLPDTPPGTAARRVPSPHVPLRPVVPADAPGWFLDLPTSEVPTRGSFHRRILDGYRTVGAMSGLTTVDVARRPGSDRGKALSLVTVVRATLSRLRRSREVTAPTDGTVTDVGTPTQEAAPDHVGTAGDETEVPILPDTVGAELGVVCVPASFAARPLSDLPARGVFGNAVSDVRDVGTLLAMPSGKLTNLRHVGPIRFALLVGDVRALLRAHVDGASVRDDTGKGEPSLDLTTPQGTWSADTPLPPHLRTLAGRLGPRFRRVFSGYFGLDGTHATKETLAEELDVGPRHVWDVLKRAVRISDAHSGWLGTLVAHLRPLGARLPVPFAEVLAEPWCRDIPSDAVRWLMSTSVGLHVVGFGNAPPQVMPFDERKLDALVARARALREAEDAGSPGVAELTAREGGLAPEATEAWGRLYGSAYPDSSRETAPAESTSSPGPEVAPVADTRPGPSPAVADVEVAPVPVRVPPPPVPVDVLVEVARTVVDGPGRPPGGYWTTGELLALTGDDTSDVAGPFVEALLADGSLCRLSDDLWVRSGTAVTDPYVTRGILLRRGYPMRLDDLVSARAAFRDVDATWRPSVGHGVVDLGGGLWGLLGRDLVCMPEDVDRVVGLFREIARGGPVPVDVVVAAMAYDPWAGDVSHPAVLTSLLADRTGYAVRGKLMVPPARNEDEVVVDTPPVPRRRGRPPKAGGRTEVEAPARGRTPRRGSGARRTLGMHRDEDAPAVRLKAKGSWTEERLATLLRMWTERRPLKEIMATLGPDFTKGMVMGKLDRMGAIGDGRRRAKK